MTKPVADELRKKPKPLFARGQEPSLQILRTATTENANGCWLWQRSGRGDGERYGVVTVLGKCWAVHRLAWTLTHGPIPGEMTVDHTCFETHCLNPQHLRLLTRPDNSSSSASREHTAHRGTSSALRTPRSTRPPMAVRVGSASPAGAKSCARTTHVGEPHEPRRPHGALLRAEVRRMTIDITVRTPAWLDDAVCASVDPAIFHPNPGESPVQAKAVCASCPVSAACLAWAVSESLTEGIWGGRTAHERRMTRQGFAA